MKKTCGLDADKDSVFLWHLQRQTPQRGSDIHHQPIWQAAQESLQEL